MATRTRLVMWFLSTPIIVWATGLHTLVVVNQNNPDSVAVGNLYCELRGVPPQNLVRLTNWTGSQVYCSTEEFTNSILRPIQTAITTRQLTNQIDYVVLSIGFPYIVYKNSGPTQTRGTNSITSVLFYGFKPDECVVCPTPPSCNLPNTSTNPLAGSEDYFRSIQQLANRTNNFIATMITATNVWEAFRFVSNGVIGDATYPTQPVYLTRSSDPIRSSRAYQYDNTIFDAYVCGWTHIISTNANGLTELPLPASGFAGSVYNLKVPSGAFVPGSLADTFTSFSGRIFLPNDHTTVLDFQLGGAALSFGTVVEPCVHIGKFPSANVYFYLTRGYTGAEAYYMSITNPYQGLLVGDPLTAPFARRASISFLEPAQDEILSGTAAVTIQAFSAGDNRPLSKIDLFMDGVWSSTITNLAPQQGNQLTVWIMDYKTNYTVPAGATIKSIAAGLAAILNGASFTNLTKVKATAIGDRILLQCIDPTLPPEAVTLQTSNSLGTASDLTTYVSPARPTFLGSPAFGRRSFTISGSLTSGDQISLTVTKTNGSTVTVSVTNSGAPTDLFGLVTSLTNAIFYHPDLAQDDGIIADAVTADLANPSSVILTIRARSRGWPAAKIKLAMAATGSITISPTGTNTMEENIDDLQPRNHLYVACGKTNLTVTYFLDTTRFPDGYHTLSVVAYEGTSPRTPTRVDIPVQIRNTSVTAALAVLPEGPNIALETTLQITVTANSAQISKIELFSSGGLIEMATNCSTSTFYISAQYLGLGWHPLYAIVTTTDGKKYRTETKRVHVVDSESPFPLSIAFSQMPFLTWQAISGRIYQVLATESLTNTFQVLQELIATNNTMHWTDMSPNITRFYRIRSVK